MMNHTGTSAEGNVDNTAESSSVLTPVASPTPSTTVLPTAAIIPPASPSQTTAPLPPDLNELDRRLRAFADAGKHANAYALLQSVLAHQPDQLKLVARVARYAVAAGKIEDADAAARKATDQGAGTPWCYRAMAIAARRRGDLAQALSLIDQGLAMPGTFADLYLERGEILRAQHKHAEAALAYESALNLNPGSWQAQQHLAGWLHATGDTARCHALCNAAIARCAANEPALLQLSKMLLSVGCMEDALAACERAAAVAPDSTGAHVNRGAILRRLSRFNEALAAYDQAIALNRDQAAAHYNRANLLKFLGRLDEAVQGYNETITREPQNGTAHWNLARALLTQGHLADGFREYEWRWQHPGFPSKARRFAQPIWTGQALAGKTLFVHSEQGQGDLILFLRFLPQLRTMGGPGTKIVVEVHDALYTLVTTQDFADIVVRRSGTPPAFDLHVPIGSLPHRLATTAKDLPAGPYLRSPPGSMTMLPARDGTRPRVGLVWAGNPHYASDAQRSMRFQQVQPLLDRQDIAWYSLQKGTAEAQLPPDAPITALGLRLDDWATTAGVLDELDLVITTCTGVANLAGAMGKAAWVMLEWDADWRWMARSQERSIWYPQLRLFRQQAPSDWHGVVDRMGDALRTHCFD